jgi:hypothetical protein
MTPKMNRVPTQGLGQEKVKTMIELTVADGIMMTPKPKAENESQFAAMTITITSKIGPNEVAQEEIQIPKIRPAMDKETKGETSIPSRMNHVVAADSVAVVITTMNKPTSLLAGVADAEAVDGRIVINETTIRNEDPEPNATAMSLQAVTTKNVAANALDPKTTVAMIQPNAKFQHGSKPSMT